MTAETKDATLDLFDVKKLLNELIEERLDFYPVGIIIADRVVNEWFLKLPDDIDLLLSEIVKHRGCLCKRCLRMINSNSKNDVDYFMLRGICYNCYIAPIEEASEKYLTSVALQSDLGPRCNIVNKP